MYTVILYPERLDRYYIGYTRDLIQAWLKKHLANHNGFTGTRTDWKIVFTAVYGDKKEAMARERQIKNRKSRIIIEKVIRSTE